LNIAENSGSEYFYEQTVRPFMRASEEDPHTSVEVDYYDEDKSMATQTYLTKYKSSSLSRVLSGEVLKYKLPKCVRQMNRKQNAEQVNILRVRKLIQYPILVERDHQIIRSGLQNWTQWVQNRTRREKELQCETSLERTEEEIEIEKNIQTRLNELSQQLANDESDESSTCSTDDASVIIHHQSNAQDENQARLKSLERTESHILGEENSTCPPSIVPPSDIPPRPLYWNLPRGRRALEHIITTIPIETTRCNTNFATISESPVSDIVHQSETQLSSTTDTILIQEELSEENFPVHHLSQVETDDQQQEESNSLSSTKFSESGKHRKTFLKKLFEPSAKAVPNFNQFQNNTRSLRTVSITQSKIALKNKLKTGTLPQETSTDTALLKIYPASITFGNLMVGEVYRCSAMLTNSGHLPGRFFIKHFNKSSWTSSYIRRAQSDNSACEIPTENILKVFCKSGPLAPGISVKIEFEIHAFRPQKMNQTVEVHTETHIIYLPVQANVVSQDEFNRQKYTLHSRVKIVQLSPVE